MKYFSSSNNGGFIAANHCQTHSILCQPVIQDFPIINKSIDILFLDIQLPKMSGIQLLHSLAEKPNVIFTTAFREFALDGYDLEITDYLLKPISFERFTKAISKIYKQKTKHFNYQAVKEERSPTFSDPFIYVKSEREHIKILLKEILYIESLKNHIKIVSSSGNIITLVALSQMESRLPKHQFIRVHRSFIVGLHHISKFTQSNVTIGDKLIPIGGFYKQQFIKQLQTYLL
ncbi:MAG: LytTR family DNA-binding domain-containing protein [Bacteroidota bacterium]